MANNQTKSKHSERSTATSEQLAAQRRLEIIYGVLQRTKLAQYDPYQFSRYTALLVSRCALLTLKRELV